MAKNNSRPIDYYLECILCHKQTTEKETTSRCLSCSGPLNIVYDYGNLKERINTYLLRAAPPKAMKYLDFYPLSQRDTLFTLHEGGTPLHNAHNLAKKIGVEKLLLKNEGMNPTGVFKDRGSFVEINKAKELGYSSICVASTGNMAASVAAYSAQGGIECYVFVPENTPRGKLAQALSYGAKVIQVRGTYNDAAALAEQAAAKYGYYLAGDYVFRLEGQKSAGYELAEYMWNEPIDYVIVPVGVGTNLSGIWKGFWEYYQLGLIQKLPKFVAVQAEGSNPIKYNKTKNSYSVEPVAQPNTVCSAIAIGNPIDAPKVFDALQQSHGYVETASDDKTLKAQQILAHTEAIYVEPSSATTLVALQNLLEKNIITPKDTVVCILTGIGLKDPATTLKVLAEPPTIEPKLSEVERVISTKLFDIRAGGVQDKYKVLFDTIPEKSEVKPVILREFHIDISDVDADEIFQDIKSFLGKGKKIAKADLQAILETAIQQEKKKNYLELEDFEIIHSKTKRPLAKIKMKLDGKSYTAESEGVGPVDATTSAIKRIVDEQEHIDFRLTDFTVEIPTGGSDATVEVTMILQEKSGIQVVEKGTSPDIIVAAMNAFVQGCNELLYQLKERKKN